MRYLFHLFVCFQKIFVSVGCSEKIFTEDGFCNWKKATGATGRLEKHLKSRAHQLSQEKAILRKTSIPTNVQLSNAEAARISKLEDEKKENQKVVEVIIDFIPISVFKTRLLGVMMRNQHLKIKENS